MDCDPCDGHFRAQAVAVRCGRVDADAVFAGFGRARGVARHRQLAAASERKGFGRARGVAFGQALHLHCVLV